MSNLDFLEGLKKEFENLIATLRITFEPRERLLVYSRYTEVVTLLKTSMMDE